MPNVCSRGLVHALLRLQAAFCPGQKQTMPWQPDICRAFSGSDNVRKLTPHRLLHWLPHHAGDALG